ncbi:hypothetical protein OHAE_1907 [Ochrobactrum soli]|uniref:Uncharacterized protein n=1 Tax=Ochrobactrum soli TaxID=2448455 RepID=A0A2P9HQG6_9HYPH|nr:hypothetical protein OHAE_1907 [[Ochrobactrum] soli]
MHSSLSVQMMENKTKPVRRVLDRVSFPTYTAAIPCRNNALSHRKRRRQNFCKATRGGVAQ